MKHRILPALALATIHFAHAGDAATALFNGSDLSGWTQRGGRAVYTIEGGEIVGTSVMHTPNSFLCTDKTYGDFVLEYEFKVDPRLNSGVQIRSQCFDHDTTVEVNGRQLTVRANVVHGYQVEIDPDMDRKRLWTAGIFDESRRGWLFPAQGEKEVEKEFSAQGLRVFKPGAWNRVRVEAVGDSIKTFLNGEPRATLRDSMTARGFIGLQVHGIGNDKSRDGAQVRWRNLTLKEIPTPANTLSEEEKAAGWRLLWDGRTTDGWRGAKADTFPAKGWEIKDGVLTVLASGGAESAAGGDIVTRERFSEFELSVDFMITAGANSGIKYLCQPDLDPVTGTGAKASQGSAIGLEFQILDDARHPDAKNGRDGNRTIGSLYDLIPAAASKRPNPPGEWNTARILVRDNHIEHWLNGAKVVSYERGSPVFQEAVKASKFKAIPGFATWPDGHILLQDHGNRVSFRNIRIRVP
jgi:hypothetical protein